MVKVQLKKRWGAHLQHAVVSVSKERAEYLEDKGIGKIIDPPKVEKTNKTDSKPDQGTESEPEKSEPEKVEQTKKTGNKNK